MYKRMHAHTTLTAYKHIRLHAMADKCAPLRRHIRTHTHTHAHTRAHSYLHTFTTYTHLVTYSHTYTHIHIFSDTNTHVHTLTG